MYCPKCDMDFVDGVTVCSDCGTVLVNKDEWFAQKAEEAAAEEKRLEKEREEKIAEMQEAINSLTDEEKEAMQDRAETLHEMMREPSVYVDDKEKYTNNQSAAIALSVVGIIIAVAAVLMWTGKIQDLGMIMKIALTGFALVCLVGAVISAINARKYKGEIQAEENLEKRIIDDFLAKYSKEDVMAAVPAGYLADEELAIERMNYIQDRLSCDNDIPDKTFSAMLAETLYEKLFEEG